jgi:DNA invertase Pin-like site-specific DNA recombinase
MMARKSRKNTGAAVAIATPAAKADNVGAYIRLSAVDRRQKGDSIENQQAIIAAYCEEYPDLIIRETYIDDGISGQVLERPAFQRMLSDMENGFIDCCVAKDLSRYGRSAIDTGYYIEKYFPACGIRCIAINDGYDSANEHSGGVMISLKNLVNESYALDVGRKIHATKQMNIRAGLFVGAMPPYGFLKSSEDGHKLVPDPIAAPIVAEIFERFVGGEGVTAIRDWLNESGTLPPRKHLYSVGVVSEKLAQGHHHWNVGALYSILKNRVYVGDMAQGKGRTQSYDVMRTEKSEWIIVENTHDPIVSRELFEEVRKRWPNRARIKSGSCNIFLRKVFCGHCGFAMRRTSAGTFKCETRQRYGHDDCVPVSIGEDTLKAILLESFHEKAANYCVATTLPAKAPQESSELSALRTELTRVTGYLKGLYESLVTGVLTQDEYADMKQGYETRIAELTAREQEFMGTARERHMRQMTVDKASGALGAVAVISDITAEVLDVLVNKIRVFDDKRIEISYKFTDEVDSVGGAEHA